MKSKVRLLLMVSAFLTGINSVVAQATLGIIVTNNQAMLFWTANASGTNGVLESSDSLASANWVSATDAIPVSYASYTAVAINPCSSVRFFRLLLVPPTADGMALIPAGSFTMGDTLDKPNGDCIPTNIYVSGFYMDTNLVTYSQWQTVYSYATNDGYGFDNAGSGKAANHPVQTVNWWDCVKWCNARSQQADLTPVYFTDASLTQVYTNGEVTPYANWSANGYRLPTEAEWEKAARGGLSGQRFPWGLTISESQANYRAAPGGYDLGPYSGYNTNFDTGGFPYTSPLGYFAANGYGLNDMAGNVYEWCWDWYGTPYGQPSTNNPTGPALGGVVNSRVLRGSSWFSNAMNARCADRNYNNPNTFQQDTGFRCVRRQ